MQYLKFFSGTEDMKRCVIFSVQTAFKENSKIAALKNRLLDSQLKSFWPDFLAVRWHH